MDNEKQLIKKNKAIRGYIMRALVRGNNNALLVRQISNALVNSQIIYSPDISKHLDYLLNAKYIEFTEKKISAFTAYQEDAVVKLTRSGVDLVEGTIEDPGVDV